MLSRMRVGQCDIYSLSNFLRAYLMLIFALATLMRGLIFSTGNNLFIAAVPDFTLVSNCFMAGAMSARTSLFLRLRTIVSKFLRISVSILAEASATIAISALVGFGDLASSGVRASTFLSSAEMVFTAFCAEVLSVAEAAAATTFLKCVSMSTVSLAVVWACSALLRVSRVIIPRKATFKLRVILIKW